MAIRRFYADVHAFSRFVTDIALTQGIIQFMDDLKKSADIENVSLCLICYRGHISGKNLRHMVNTVIGYILMQHTTIGLYGLLADAVIDRSKSYKYELQTSDGGERYGISQECTLYKGGLTCYEQIMWSSEQDHSKRSEAANTVRAYREKPEALKELPYESTGLSNAIFLTRHHT